jgi:hypothetical protein
MFKKLIYPAFHRAAANRLSEYQFVEEILVTEKMAKRKRRI